MKLDNLGDYTERASRNSHYSSFPQLPNAWIYIAIDIRDMNLCKIGLTTKPHPRLRIGEGKTYNPFLELFTIYELSACTWGCSQEELNDIESYFHSRATFGGAIKYPSTMRDSEWFFTAPYEAEFQIDWMIAKRGFSVDGWCLYETCERKDRDQKRLNNINVEGMKRIKTIFRPDPCEYISKAASAGMQPYQYQYYVNYLRKYHNGDWIDKIYLK